VQPILEIQRVAQQIGTGDLTVLIRSDRRDEIGDVARAVAAMVGSLRATVGRVAQAADGVEGTADGIAQVTERLASVTAEQVAGNAVAVETWAASPTRWKASPRPSASAHALDLAVDGSSSSFRGSGASAKALAARHLLDPRRRDFDSSADDAGRATGGGEHRRSQSAENTANSMENGFTRE
jgi:hypothetical protein